MPRSSTGPEVALRRALHARGLRFTLHPRDLPGTPDIVLTAARIAIFVDGCFWHGCTDHGTLPKNNHAWWQSKLAANAERDRRKDAELIALGWTPLHFWEHGAVDEIVGEIVPLWRVRTGRG
jgi:DNA mismatch endonuclease (patch repair protein)